jgi:nicotinate-nucleotide pyrophosphorylase (carboxylating)
MDEIIKYMLAEDKGYGDITSDALISPDIISEGYIISKEEGVLAGISLIKDIFSQYDITILNSLNDGDKIKKGDKLIEFKGQAKTILLIERTVLNLLMRMSGVATKTNNIVTKVHNVNPKIRVAGTRKTAPALQNYDKQAIIIGGGDSHRNGLDDMVLIKDNHIAIVGSVSKALDLAKNNVSFSKKIEIEVENSDDAIIAAEKGADIIMFDNMSPKEALKTLNLLKENNLRNNVLIELSGGITEDNILDYALLDVDIISLGALTHSTRSLNFSLDM